MNAAYWHIATNHIPVIAMPFCFVLLLWAIVRKSPEVLKVTYLALIVTALITIVVDQTGGPAARIVRTMPGVERADIHEHAEAADFGFAAAEIAGGLALVGLWLMRKETASGRWSWLVLIVTLWASTVLARVAHLGGLIRHSEIHAAQSVPKSPTPL